MDIHRKCCEPVSSTLHNNHVVWDKDVGPGELLILLKTLKDVGDIFIS